MRYSLRRATRADRQAIFDICIGTAAGGADATSLYGDRRLPGLIWAVGYLHLEPDFAFVLRDGDRAVGYTLGTPDTAAFQKQMDRRWWPMVRRLTAGIQATTPADERALARIAAPLTAPEWLLEDYPAHFHLNILPEAQRRGWGKWMTDAQMEALQLSGTRGVHFGISAVNKRALDFYRRIGFEEIGHGQAVYFGRRF